ncbi:Fc.00g038040.m01.CDS01 [Cosmosporella sp. VM-42]
MPHQDSKSAHSERQAIPSDSNSLSDTPVRTNSPNGEGTDATEAASTHQGVTFNENPFIGAEFSRPASSHGSSGNSNTTTNTQFEERHSRYFHSRRIKPDEIEKPWLDKVDPKEKWVTIMPILAIVLGLAASGLLIWDGLNSVAHHTYCPVLDEDWTNGFDTSVWTKEVEVGGFGNGEFEQTTPGDENVYIENGVLIIKPTLQDANLMEKNNVINLLKDKTCTGTSFQACVAATNTTNGNATVVPPTRSGRINTKKGATIKYGSVEVTAKLPQGDWLWPAIWMMPVKNTYGPWPASGEIDIMESRGNNWTYEQGGNNIVSSALHWGPNPANDAWWKTNNKRKSLHKTYSDEFNTFGVEWSQKYIFTYVNNRLLTVLYTNFKKPLWQRGGFPDANANGTRLEDPWSDTGKDNTPFDQEFYLILNVAVGGTNGWFEDSKSDKPWIDGSPSAKKDFWEAQDQWYPTWTQPQMEIKRVVIKQQCDGNEDL